MKFKTLLPLILISTSIISCRNCNNSSSTSNQKIASKNSTWKSLEKNERIGQYHLKDGKVYCGESGCTAESMSGVDLPSFMVSTVSDYAKDHDHVYYPITILCVDGKDCGACYATEYIVKGAQPSSFKGLTEKYGKDLQHGYFEGKEIPKSDGKSFKAVHVSKYTHFAVDKNYVYYNQNIFEEADPDTFYYDSVSTKKLNTYDQFEFYIFEDATNKWKYTPPDTFKKLAKD